MKVKPNKKVIGLGEAQKESLALKGKPNPCFKIFHRSAMEGILSLTGIIGLSHVNAKNIKFNSLPLKYLDQKNIWVVNK